MGFFIRRKACPACGYREHKAIYSCSFNQAPFRPYLESYYGSRAEFEYLKGATFILDECNNCGLIYQREIPDDFLMKKLYEDWIAGPKIGSELQGENRRFDYKAEDAREVNMLIAYFNVNPARLDFLDVGMGWESWCLAAKAVGCNTYGIELSRALIELGRSNGINVITWDELVGSSFDFINTEQFFEHIGSPLETLRYLKKSLKTNGLIKISVPDGADLKRRLNVCDWTAARGTKNSLHIVHPLEHINCYKRLSVIKMAKIAGLQEVKMSIWFQYIYGTNWRSVRKMAKNLLRPLYYNVLQKGTYLFFRNK